MKWLKRNMQSVHHHKKNFPGSIRHQLKIVQNNNFLKIRSQISLGRIDPPMPNKIHLPFTTGTSSNQLEGNYFLTFLGAKPNLIQISMVLPESPGFPGMTTELCF